MSKTHDVSEHAYSTAEAVEVTGATKRQIDYWFETGMIRPARVTGIGSGYRREWSHNDLLFITLLVRLKQAGLRHVQTRRVADLLDGVLPANGLLCGPVEWVIDPDTTDVAAAMVDWEFVVWIPTMWIAGEVRERSGKLV